MNPSSLALSKVLAAAPHKNAPGSNPGKDSSLIGGNGFESQNIRYRF